MSSLGLESIQEPYDPKLTREARIADLRDLRATFKDGHTDEDVNYTLAEIERLTGLECCVVWAFEDMWGIGGDSELFCFKPETRTLWQVPSELNDYLYDADTTVQPEALLDLKRGKYISNAPGMGDAGYNLVRRRALQSDLG